MFGGLTQLINDLLQDEDVLILNDNTKLGDKYTLKDLRELSDDFNDVTLTDYEYLSMRDMKELIESERIDIEPGNVLTTIEKKEYTLPEINLDITGIFPIRTFAEQYYEGWDNVMDAYFDEFLDDDNNKMNKMFKALSEAHKSDNARVRALADQIEQTTITFPHMRKRRKQWAGQPTYRTAELEPKKMKGYSMRSLMRKMPTITPLLHKQVQERMKRSISHIQLWSRIEISPIESLKYNFDLNLWEAHVAFCERLFYLEQANTDMKAQAWDIYLPSGLLEDFIESYYEPTISGFAGLPSAMKSFIASAWDEYKYEARNQRQERYGMNLSKQDVLHRTSKADKSIFKHQFGG
ncbi:hypothetical protein [Staphylococcus sp. GDY8P44P]|uniref:hypothetical protein n=1 Tax=Staphylococcus sp. GDY8P44P TaxID=2804119 RepID=UPI001AEC5045|nr:hypothetical protein [Staphylococcus sp. GDY8P44P]